AAPPAPAPGLWQIHGVAKSGASFPLLSVASVKGSDRREGKLSARLDGGTLVVSETGGCRRTARLSRASRGGSRSGSFPPGRHAAGTRQPAAFPERTSPWRRGRD